MKAHKPEWDGEPVEPVYAEQETPKEATVREPKEPKNEKEPTPKIKIKLRDGKEKEISHSVNATFWGPDGKLMTIQEFLNMLYGKLPDFFKSEEELRKIWSNPITRKALLDKLAEAGFGQDGLNQLQKLIDAEKSDLFDVLEYIAFSVKPMTRQERVATAQDSIYARLDKNQKEFLEFVLSKYIETGVEELAQDKLPSLLELKYHAINDAASKLGPVGKIRELFIEFQQHLYKEKVA